MNKSITADATITKQTSQRMVIEWPDNLGDPTDANVLKALRDGTVDYDDIIDEDEIKNTVQADSRETGRQTMRDKAMPLGKKFKVRLTITPEETGTPVDMLGFTFTSGRNGRMELDTEYNNIPKLADDGLDSLSILVILKTLEMWAQKGYELFQPIAQRFHGDGR